MAQRPAQCPVGPVLEADMKILDFGVAPQHSYLIKKVILRSTGDQPVIIDSINTYCSCITIPFSREPIEPGDSIITELSLYTSNISSDRQWQSHIHSNGPGAVRIRVKVKIITDVKRFPFISVIPHTVGASQFGETVIREFPINLINKSDEHIPLKLVYTDNEFYTLDFPVFIPPPGQ